MMMVTTMMIVIVVVVVMAATAFAAARAIDVRSHRAAYAFIYLAKILRVFEEINKDKP